MGFFWFDCGVLSIGFSISGAVGDVTMMIMTNDSFGIRAWYIFYSGSHWIGVRGKRV